jgi:hypothetical protein
MVIRLSLDTESRLQEFAAATGCTPDDLVEDAISGYLTELSQVRNLLDSRYDDVKIHHIQPLAAKKFFANRAKRAKTAAILTSNMLAIRHATPALS